MSNIEVPGPEKEKGLLEFFGELFNGSPGDIQVVNEGRLALIYQDILDERARQEQLKVEGKFAGTCADDLPEFEKLAVLAEEFGEVAKEVCEANNTGARVPSNLRKELIQVATVAVAWIEALDKELDEVRMAAADKFLALDKAAANG